MNYYLRILSGEILTLTKTVTVINIRIWTSPKFVYEKYARHRESAVLSSILK